MATRLSRTNTDGVIAGWKASAKVAQDDGRGSGKWGGHYGQVLPDGARPHDQAQDGPTLPQNPNVVCWIDVYEGPTGKGWTATFEAKEGQVTYRRSVSSHEGGPLVETEWVTVEETPVVEA